MKSKLWSDAVRQSARKECAIHSIMKHKNITELYEYTRSEEEISLYLEFANKESYLTETVHDGHTPIEDEHLLRKLGKDILEGLRYIHSQGIIHGDIKLPNLLWHEEDDVISVKIWDFGLSHIVDPKTKEVVITDVSGTFGHIAPEVKSYCHITTAVDMWCYGLVLYEMAVAYKPTQMKNFSYSDSEIPFRRADWRRKSPLLIDLISKLMRYEPEERITAEEALQHPWFSQDI
jgi:serine/threonine protein kinase